MLNNSGRSWAESGKKGNAVAGSFYGPNHETCTLPNNMTNCIFLPISGEGRYGHYWSSTEWSRGSTNGYALYFSSWFTHPFYNSDKRNEFSVRCVFGGGKRK